MQEQDRGRRRSGPGSARSAPAWSGRSSGRPRGPPATGCRAGQPEQLLEQRLAASAPAASAASGRAGRSARCRRGRAGSAIKGAASRPPAAVEQRLQLVEPASSGSSARQARRVVQLLDHRPQRAVGVVGRALVADAHVRLLRQRVEQRPADPRLADAGLAESSTTWPSPALACAQRSSSSASSCSRPTIGVSAGPLHRLEAALDAAARR